MSLPQPPEIVLPDGRMAYLNPYSMTYTTSRSYARRLQRGWMLGQTRTQARGRNLLPGQSESQQRAERFSDRYGYDETTYRRWQRKYISRINELAHPSARLTPDMVAVELQNGRYVGHDVDWMEWKLQTLLRAYEENAQGDKSFGKALWENNAEDRELSSFIEFWYYHGVPQSTVFEVAA